MTDQISHWDRLSSHPPDASVLDPLDRRGYKNRYIAELRNTAVLEAFDANRVQDPVLDFGCGTGGLSVGIGASGRRVVGVDISMGLLRRTSERASLAESAVFVRYDGQRLPVRDGSIAGACTYVVLNHILDDSDLSTALSEIHRVLTPGGTFVAIEQVRRKRTLDTTVWQCRRSIAEFLDLFAKAGFLVRSADVVRFGRFPAIPLIRIGAIPPRLFPLVRGLEAGVGRIVGPVPWDYSDVRFVLSKPE